MSNKKLFIYILLVSLLTVFTQGSCNHNAPSQDIEVYISEGSEQVRDATVLNKQKPAMKLKKSNIKRVELTQYRENLFTLKIDLISNTADELEKITSENIGKRIAFVKDSKILFTTFILAVVTKPIIVLEFSSSETYAKDMADDFDKSFVFVNKQPVTSNLIGTALKEASKLRHKREYDEAIKILQTALNKTNNNEEKVDLYSEMSLCYMLKKEYDEAIKILKIALNITNNNEDKVDFYSEMSVCYWLKKDNGNAAKANELLVKQPITINFDNYGSFVVAYRSLIEYEKKHGDTKKADYYSKRINDILEYIIKNYPLTLLAQRANLDIAEYKLYKGNIKDIEKRALLAIKGDIKPQGYMLLAACYEYQGKYKDAEKIYEKVIKDFPNSQVGAQWYLNSLKHNKSKVKEEIKKFNQGVLYPTT